MYAVVRINNWDEAKRAAASDKVEEFDRIHAEQPGFHGSLVVDLGEGREAIVNLWESEEKATRALPVMGPTAGRLLNPVLAAPSQLVGTGEVVRGAELVAVRRD